ncbi:Pentatricopeptide repeat-containing protein [Raphanus sativus]|nr:Pentatricopeptide repeat-containing protein [Raphanus sativus]
MRTQSSPSEHTHEESNVSGLGFSESVDLDVNGTMSGVGEDGESEIATVEASGDGSVVAEEVSQFDEEKFESLLSLLRSDEESLEFGLKALDLDLNSDLVARVFESTGLKWATKKEEVTVTTSLLESLLVVISGDNRRRLDAYALWDLVKEISENENSLVLNLEIMNDLIALFGKLGKSKAAFDVFSKPKSLALLLTPRLIM